MLLALGVAGYSLWLLLAEQRPDFAAALFARQPVGALLHLACSPIALVAGALQVNAALRARCGVVHRWVGRLYVLAVLLGGISGMSMALTAHGGPMAQWGFGMLAGLWLFSTGSGLLAIRRGAPKAHRDWMLRSYALTTAAITLRIYIPTSLSAGLAFDDAYRAIAWLCWVPNLLAAEWMIRRLRHTHPHGLA